MNTQILESIRSLKNQILPNGRLILFGSQARGDERPDSDWDLLLIVDSESLNLEQGSKYFYPFMKLGWSYDVEINVLVYSKDDWEKGYFTPLYKNVQKDGIEIK